MPEENRRRRSQATSTKNYGMLRHRSPSTHETARLAWCPLHPIFRVRALTLFADDAKGRGWLKYPANMRAGNGVLGTIRGLETGYPCEDETVSSAGLSVYSILGDFARGKGGGREYAARFLDRPRKAQRQFWD